MKNPITLPKRFRLLVAHYGQDLPTLSSITRTGVVSLVDLPGMLDELHFVINSRDTTPYDLDSWGLCELFQWAKDQFGEVLQEGLSVKK
jgi:hypothetical protein